jgi:outer membrane protein
MRARCLLAWVLAAPLALALPRLSHAEDLLQAWQQARAADPVLAAALAARGVVREGVAQVRAPLLPQAAASLSFDQNHVAGRDDNRARGAGVAVSQVLVDVAQRKRLQAALQGAEAQDAVYSAAEQALLVRVATAYFEVLTATDLLAAVAANEDAFAQQVDQADQRYRNGLTALVDVEQARAFRASARANTLAAQKALADAREALAEITGAAPGVLARLREALPMDPPSPADPQAWVNAALAQNPLLRAQRSLLGAAEENIAAARAGHLPTLSAALNSGRNSAWPLAGGNDGRHSTTVGLVLSVPLFSGGGTSASQRQAAYQRDGAREDLEQRRRRVVREVQEQYRAVVAGIGQTEATREAVMAAQRALASTRVGQGLGTQSMNDLLQAIQTLGATQAAYSRARHQFVLSRLLLQQAAGTVGEAELTSINSLLQ